MFPSSDGIVFKGVVISVKFPVVVADARVKVPSKVFVGAAAVEGIPNPLVSLTIADGCVVLIRVV